VKSESILDHNYATVILKNKAGRWPLDSEGKYQVSDRACDLDQIG